MLKNVRALVGIAGTFALSLGLGACSQQVSDPTASAAAGDTAEQSCNSGTDFQWDRQYKRTVETGYYKGADGKKIRVRTYEHIGQDKAVVVFLNGRSEFIEKYDVLFSGIHGYPQGPAAKNETLADLPITFITIDHEGQGDSIDGRTKSHVDNFDNYVEDLKNLFDKEPMLNPHIKRPVYIMSHSMGGLVASRFAQKYPNLVDGLILSSPMLKIAPPAPLSVEQLGQVAGFYAAPAPYGLGLPKLCSAPPGIDTTTLASIAICHQDATLTSCFYNPTQAFCGGLTQCLLLGYPNECGLPAIPFAQLNGALQYLKMQPEGCGPRTMSCPDTELGTDTAYCQFTESSPLWGPSATLGWIYQSIAGGATFEASPNITVPTLILSNTDDKVVDPAMHNCSKFTGECKVVQYTGYGHELLATGNRAAPISEIRTWLKKHTK